LQKKEARFAVGGKWAFVSIGREPLTAINGADVKLHGNYGVFYEIAATLENPTDQTQKARVVFEPSAGMAGGVFVMRDKEGEQVVTIPQTDLPTETTLGSYLLAPGEKKDVTIRTMPLSGSNYPATIILRP
jgi:hypothetical protein